MGRIVVGDPADLTPHLELIALTDERDEDKTPVEQPERLCALVAFVLQAEGIVPMGVTISLVDESAMHALNREHMDTDRPTDVLAFPLDSPDDAAQSPELPHLLGDVVLAPRYIAHQASEHNKSTDDELEMLTVHGALHLLGYDHAEEEERKVMFGLTDELLATWKAQTWTP